MSRVLTVIPLMRTGQRTVLPAGGAGVRAPRRNSLLPIRPPGALRGGAANGPCRRLSFLTLLCTLGVPGGGPHALHADAFPLRPEAPRDKGQLRGRADREGPGRVSPWPRKAAASSVVALAWEPPQRSRSLALAGRGTPWRGSGALAGSLWHAAGAPGAPRLEADGTLQSGVLAHSAHRPQRKTCPHAHRQRPNSRRLALSRKRLLLGRVRRVRQRPTRDGLGFAESGAPGAPAVRRSAPLDAPAMGDADRGLGDHLQEGMRVLGLVSVLGRALPRFSTW
jgi:hypothetical protein